MEPSKESLQDILEEPAHLEDNDRTAEEYHISMLAASGRSGSQGADIHKEAAQALRAASSLTMAEFFKKWR